MKNDDVGGNNEPRTRGNSQEGVNEASTGDARLEPGMAKTSTPPSHTITPSPLSTHTPVSSSDNPSPTGSKPEAAPGATRGFAITRQTGSIVTPADKEEWDSFILRYASGDYHYYDFPSLKAGASGTGGSESSRSRVRREDKSGGKEVDSRGPEDASRAAGKEDGQSRSGRSLTKARSLNHPPRADSDAESSSNVTRHLLRERHSDATIIPRTPSIRDMTPTPRGSITGQQTPLSGLGRVDSFAMSGTDEASQFRDSHPDTSTSGPVNQDPEIPNIGLDELPTSPSGRSMFKGGVLDEALVGFNGAVAGAGASEDKNSRVEQDRKLTREHIHQLDKDQRKAQVKARKVADDEAAVDAAEDAEDYGASRVKGKRNASSRRKSGTGDEGDVEVDADDHNHGYGRGNDSDSDEARAGPSKQRQHHYHPAPLDVGLGAIRKTHSVGSSPSDEEGSVSHSLKGSTSTRPRPGPRSRGSYRSRRSNENDQLPIERVLESATGSSVTASHADIDFDYATEVDRVREFFEANGYMPAPRQPPDVARLRLRVIRRLGLEKPDKLHRTILDRFTRLAVSIFKTKRALVTVVGRDRQIFLSKIGFNQRGTGFEDAFCCHTIIGGQESCMVVPDANDDWRFKKNPLVDEGRGPVQFYAGAPLIVGKGAKAVVIGSMCVIDEEPRGDFGEEEMRLLKDLAECAVSEMELLYNQKSITETAKLHQISVDFLRRSLKHRPHERAGTTGSRPSASGPSGPGASTSTGDNASSTSGKRKSGADSRQADQNLDIFDEACAEIRHALDAYAVAIVDLSQFHLFYPSYQTSTSAGSTRTGSVSATSTRRYGQRGGMESTSRSGTPIPSGNAFRYNAGGEIQDGARSSRGTTPDRANEFGVGAEAGSMNSFNSNQSTMQDYVRDEPEEYQSSGNRRAARSTYAVRDPMAPSRTPQVLFIPSYATKSRTSVGRSTVAAAALAAGTGTGGKPENGTDDGLAVLGYSAGVDGFAFNFATTPAARRIVCDFIANNVKDRSVWYTRDDSVGIAQSITHLMPTGTETSLAMPIFGFDGQVAFAVVACWTDPLYSYPAGALQFVETIAGSLLASVMKEKLHQAERAQLNFAAAASHELRTPLHQINAAAALLRQSLQHALVPSPANSPVASRSSSLHPSELSTGTNNGSSISGSSDSPDTLDTRDDSNSTQTTRTSRESLHTGFGREEKHDAMAHLEMIEANGIALGQILENIIDTLDIGRLSANLEETISAGEGANLGAGGIGSVGGMGGVDQDGLASAAIASGAQSRSSPSMNARAGTIPAMLNGDERVNLADLMEKVILDTVSLENKSRRISGRVGLDDVEVLLEMMPRIRGGWLVASNPGPLMRALGKIIHNSCKFTDKGYIHITVQDISRDVALPTGYDNPIKLSSVAIDIKDTGKGMTSAFLEDQILQPFAKADPFMPGSGLGLSLAQRMIELLAGKLAIKSTLNKGTLIHIEIPLHLYSVDNNSDQEDLESQSRSNDFRPVSPVRKDGIYLYGFDKGNAGTRRVGRVLVRQMKLRFCRVIDGPQYASLIIVPDSVPEQDVARVVRNARSNVEVIVLCAAGHRLDSGSETNFAGLNGIQITALSRPLLPSTIRRITRPGEVINTEVETYKSEVVGGEEATAERLAAAAQLLHRPEARRVSHDVDDDDPFSTPANRQNGRDPTIASTSHTRSVDDELAEILPSPLRVPIDLPIETMETDWSSSGSSQSGSVRGPGDKKDSGDHGIEGSIACLPTDGESYMQDAINRAERAEQAERAETRSGSSSRLEQREGDGESSADTVNAGVSHFLPPVRPPLEGQMTDPGPISPPSSSSPGPEEQGADPAEGVTRSMAGLGLEMSDKRPGFGKAHGHSLPAAALYDQVETGVQGEGAVAGVKADGPGEVVETQSRGVTDGRGTATATEEVDARAKADASSPPQERVLKVLVVEDNPVNRRILTTMLKRTACHFAEAVDGNDAVRQFLTFLPDLVLLDINMPGKDGFQASSEMRAIEAERNAGRKARGEQQSGPKQRAKIVAVTALSAEGAKRKGMLECGIDEWRTKPVSIKQLREDVERMKI